MFFLPIKKKEGTKMNKIFNTPKLIGTTSFIFLTLSSTFYGKTFKIIPTQKLPIVYIDIPLTWSIKAKQKGNGIITVFKPEHIDPEVFIEVRTLKLNSPLNISSLVNAKSARLSAEFSQIDLLKENSAPDNKNNHYTLWKLKEGYQFYIEQSVLLSVAPYLTIVSCRSPEKKFNKYKIICDNALVSTRMYPIPSKKNQKRSLPNNVNKKEPSTNLSKSLPNNTNKKVNNFKVTR